MALAWLLPDEGGLSELFHTFLNRGATVPSHWRIEVANGLLVAQRRKRVDQGFARDALATFSRVAVTVDQETGSRAWNEAFALADRFNLTSYDAAYLELAARVGLPLATLDGRLAAAAESLGVASALRSGRA